MSILINGVSLGDFKPICPCLNGDYGCCDIPGIKRCYGIGKDGCPLIPVPAHGRLIDADALVRDNGIKEIPEYYEVVRDAPTVIEAEEADHD